MRLKTRGSASKRVVVSNKRRKKKARPYSLILGQFRAIERPAFIETLQFPSDLTRLQAENISQLHSQYSVLFAFANQELADSEVEIIRLNRRRAKREADILKERGSLSNIEKWKRDQIIATHPAIGHIEDQLTLMKMKVRYLVSLKENYDRLIASLSREQSRRQAYSRPEYSV